MRIKRDPRQWWSGWLFILLMSFTAAMLCIVFGGCAPRTPANIHGPTINPFVQTHAAVDDLEGLFTWVVAVGIFGIGACIAATVFLSSIIPSLAKWSVAGAAGFGAILILAVFFKVALPFLPWVALGLLGVGIALGIWYLRNHPEIFRLRSQVMQQAIALGSAQTITVGTPPVEVK